MSQVLVMGGANVDITAKCAHGLVLGDSNLGLIHTSFGGVARNIVENLARLGAQTQFISAVGADVHGLALRAHCEALGVDVSALVCDAQARTSMYVSIHDDSGELHVAVNDMAILEQIDAAFMAKHAPHLHKARLIVAEANLSEDALAGLFANATSPIFVDAVSAAKALRIKPYLSQIHTLKPNRIEAEILSGLVLNNDIAIETAAQWFLAQGVQQVVLSLAERGLYCASTHEQGWVKPFATEIVNTSGAGDALMSGLAFGYLQGYGLLESARFAQGCAALTLGASGTNCETLSCDAVQTICQVHTA